MKKMKRIFALALACMLLVLCTGCGAGSLLIGSWTDDSESMTLIFKKDGQAVIQAYSIPMESTYEYSGDTLTIMYTETISETGTLTFFGDNEFIWEKEDKNGEPYQEHYTRVG